MLSKLLLNLAPVFESKKLIPAAEQATQDLPGNFKAVTDLVASNIKALNACKLKLPEPNLFAYAFLYY